MNNNYYIIDEAEDYPQEIATYFRNIVDDRVVLEIGCGIGNYLRKIEDYSSICYGVSSSDEELDYADSKMQSDNVHIICSNLSNISLNDKSMDVVYSINSISKYNMDKRKSILKEMQRLVKESGSIYIAEYDINPIIDQYTDGIMDRESYYKWLEENNFIKVNEINTYYNFHSTLEANNYFNSTYYKNINVINDKKIDCKLIVFKQQK